MRKRSDSFLLPFFQTRTRGGRQQTRDEMAKRDAIQVSDSDTDTDTETDNARLFRMWDSMRIAFEQDAGFDEFCPSSSSSSSSSSHGGVQRPLGKSGLGKSIGAPTRDLVNLEDQLLTVWSECKNVPLDAESGEGEEEAISQDDGDDDGSVGIESEVSDLFERVMAVESLIQTQLLPPDHSVPIDRIVDYQSAAVEELSILSPTPPSSSSPSPPSTTPATPSISPSSSSLNLSLDLSLDPS